MCKTPLIDDGQRGPGKNGPLTVVCFGDSITGFRPGQEYRGQYLKWADLLQLMLEGRLGPGQVAVVNSGWAGDRTTPNPAENWPGAVGRLAGDLLDYRPQIAVILIGGNDVADTNEQRAATRANLEAIVRTVRQAGIQVLLLQYHQPSTPPGKEARGWKHLAAKNPAIAEVAREVGVPTLDMGPAIAEAVRQYPSTDVVNGDDGVHLNPRGEMAYARAVFARLVALGWV